MNSKVVKVFLVRHADADADIPEGLGDEARALTTKARASIASHFQSLKERFDTPSLFLASPLVRAVQTAQILSITLGYEGPLRTHRSLLPDMPVGAIDGVLNEPSLDTLVLVGHNPSMTAMAAHLLGMQNFPKPVTPGTVIALEREGQQTKLLFYAPPGQAVLESV
jgi:phosphohistidine phosphatase